MPSCKDVYMHINGKCHDILVESFNGDTQNIQSKAHSFLQDLSVWQQVLASRPESPLLESAFREYEYALLAVVQGQYRQAYTSLRFLLEHTLAAVYFSAHEYQLRLWMAGQQDIYWNTIIDLDNGVFSRNFVRAFCEPLCDESGGYTPMAKQVYRECSEFTHGNFGTITYLPSSLEYSEELFNDWHEKAETVRLIVVFALCVRYLTQLGSGEKQRLESTITEHLGHLTEIQAFYAQS